MDNDLTEYNVARDLAMGLFTFLYMIPAWALAKFGNKQAQRLVSQAWDLSSCDHCETSFDFVTAVAITYLRNDPPAANGTVSKAICPLCENCFETLPIELIDWYIESCIHSRKRYYPPLQETDLGEEEIESDAKAEARQMKALIAGRL